MKSPGWVTAGGQGASGRHLRVLPPPTPAEPWGRVGDQAVTGAAPLTKACDPGDPVPAPRMLTAALTEAQPATSPPPEGCASVSFARMFPASAALARAARRVRKTTEAARPSLDGTKASGLRREPS